jgi:hypothetical protein
VKHGQVGLPKLIADIDYAGSHHVYVHLVGVNASFLDECLNANARHGMFPSPWVAFPRSYPGSGWNQGVNEDWIRLAFLPFWSTLNPASREAYLEHWGASTEWADWLSNASPNSK